MRDAFKNQTANLSRFGSENHTRGARFKHRSITDDDVDYMNKNCPRARFDWVMKNVFWQCNAILQIGGSLSSLTDSRFFEDQGKAQRVVSIDPSWPVAETSKYTLRKLNIVGWAAHVPVSIKDFNDADAKEKAEIDCILDMDASTEMQFQQPEDWDAFKKLSETANHIAVGTVKSRVSPIDQLVNTIGVNDWSRMDIDLDCSTDIDVLGAKVPPKADQAQFHVTVFSRMVPVGHSTWTQDNGASGQDYKDRVYEAAMAAGTAVAENAKNATADAANAATEDAQDQMEKDAAESAADDAQNSSSSSTPGKSPPLTTKPPSTKLPAGGKSPPKDQTHDQAKAK